MFDYAHKFNIPDVLHTKVKDHCLWIFFDRKKETNPFSRKLTVAIIQLAQQLAEDPDIKCVIFSGGKNRSFSSGGDFNDVQTLKEFEETKLYLYEIIDLYQAILKIPQPTIAAVDFYAIGQGLQVSLMTDWRIATERAKISMPELKNGVACPLGTTILQNFFGRAQMLEDVVGCSMMTAKQAFKKKYFNHLCKPGKLFAEAEKMAVKLTNYSQIPYSTTKKIYNEGLIAALESVRVPAGIAHAESIMSMSAQGHFSKILNKK